MKLFHLFPDLLNLYGDYGNLWVLRSALEASGLEVQLVPVAPGETPEAVPGDLLYMGPGTEPALHKALEHLRPMASLLRAALDAGVPMLFTGNSWLTLGHTLTTQDGQVLEGLSLADFTATETGERYTGDVIAQSVEPALPQPSTVGFQNRCDRVEGIAAPLFTMTMGQGNAPGEQGEGLHQGSLFCTHLTGPLLVKNPHLLSHFATLLGGQYQPAEGGHALLAYQTTLKALQARQG